MRRRRHTDNGIARYKAFEQGQEAETFGRHEEALTAYEAAGAECGAARMRRSLRRSAEMIHEVLAVEDPSV